MAAKPLSGLDAADSTPALEDGPGDPSSSGSLASGASGDDGHPHGGRETSLWRRRPGTLLAAVGGVVAALGIPPTDLFPAVLVGLGIMGLAVERHRARRAWLGGLGVGVVWGTVAGLVGMRFVPDVIARFTPLPWLVGLLALVLLAAAQSLPWGVGMAVASTLRRRHVPLALSVAIGVMVALSLPTIFFWSPAGLLTPWPLWVQAADILGDRGLSALFAAIGTGTVQAAVAFAARRTDTSGSHRPWAVPAIAAATGLAALVAYGLAAIPPEEGPEPHARLGLVHAAVPPKDRWERDQWPSILAKLKARTVDAELDGIDLAVWPEAAYPYPLPHTARQAPSGRGQIVGGGIRGPILFGFIALDHPQRTADGWIHNRFNSATIVGRDLSLQPSYDKMRLLWFGETVPFGDQIPWLRETFQRSGGLLPGAEIRPLVLDRPEPEVDLRMGVLNCYEDTIPGYARRVQRALRPNLLVNVTNDAWFRGSAEPMLHHRLAALRAIENRRDLVRAVNLGVTGWIDAGGRVRAMRTDEEPYAIVVEPALRDDPPTWYVRFGDATAWVLLAFASGAHVVARRRGNAKAS